MQSESVVQQVAIGLIWRNDCLVVGRRPEGKPLAGYFEFPGGKCEPGETPLQTVVRECLEETGLRVHATSLRLVGEQQYAHGRLRLHFVDCTLAEPSDEIPELPPPFQWIPRNQVVTLSFPAGNDEVLRTLRDL